MNIDLMVFLSYATYSNKCLIHGPVYQDGEINFFLSTLQPVYNLRSVEIENLTDQDARIRCDALVDTGASYMALPDAWRDRLGELDEITTVPLDTAAQETVEGKIFGPVRLAAAA